MKYTFGRHETFAPRYSWLTRGYQLVVEGLNLNNADEATLKLGVGKNMVASIKFWLRAFQLIDDKTNTPTAIGFYIFDEEEGKDPYLEDETTIWLLHWLLSTNKNIASSWWWFFNEYHRTDFTSLDVQKALEEHLSLNVNSDKRINLNSIRKDINVILRMYSSTGESTRVIAEESLDSPLSLLKLIKRNDSNKNYISNLEFRNFLQCELIGYALSIAFKKHKGRSIAINELMNSSSSYYSLGSIFRITEECLISKIEHLISSYKNTYEIRDTGGINLVYKLYEEVNEVDFLDKYYKD